MKLAICLFIWILIKLNVGLHAQNTSIKTQIAPTSSSTSNFKLINPSFLGTNERNYYGNEAPDTLEVIWKQYLGQGETVISRKLGTRIWAGAGWTGQPLLISEDTNLYIIQGAYDHHLKKIDAITGELIWQYEFDDVVKGTGSIWVATNSIDPENKIVILQGSRLGVGNFLDSKYIPSYRAISYFTGNELWRLNVKWTDSYSRDVDGSALILNDTAYIGLENSLFTILNPSPQKATIIDGMLQPEIIAEYKLYTIKDANDHNNNVVTESSPCLLDSVIYVASGSGHVHGYSMKEKKLVWDFYIGSDIDGSSVVTKDKCLLVSIEKQYITGQGGVFKLNPALPADSSVIWYCPTENEEYSGWLGGIIGSCAINDSYNNGDLPYLSAFSAIDGYLYVVKHRSIDTTKMVYGPRGEKLYHTPEIVFKYRIGASISTPLIVQNKIIAAGYGGIFLFEFDKNLHFKRLAKFPSAFESTPFVHNKKVYIASRDGYFYCLGKN